VQSHLGPNWSNFYVRAGQNNPPTIWGPVLQDLFARLLDLGNLRGWKGETAIGYKPSFLAKTGCFRTILMDVVLIVLQVG
jgi:hypothetical protein